MQKTRFSRKLDTCGRLVLPKKLREEMNLVIGDAYDFFVHEQDNRRYLCIECPQKPDEVALALEVLKKNGFKIEINESN